MKNFYLQSVSNILSFQKILQFTSPKKAIPFY